MYSVGSLVDFCVCAAGKFVYIGGGRGGGVKFHSFETYKPSLLRRYGRDAAGCLSPFLFWAIRDGLDILKLVIARE